MPTEAQRLKRHMQRARRGLKNALEIYHSEDLSPGERELLGEQLEEIRQTAEQGAKGLQA